MGHSVGSMLLPVPVPAQGESVGDPAIDVLGSFFETVLTAWLSAAWSEVAGPREPVVRKIYTHDPEEADFISKDLPLLCVWRTGGAPPKKLTDDHHEVGGLVNVLWLPPPATQRRQSHRHPFFAAFSRAISFAIQNERDASWVRAGDTSDEAAAYGTNVVRAASLDAWALRSIDRIPVSVSAGKQNFTYPGYMASLEITETTVTDPGAYNVYPTSIEASLVTAGDDPVERFRLLVPAS